MAKYVVAGGSTVSSISKLLIDHNFATADTINNFIENTTDLCLTSVGECLSRKQKFNKEKFVSKVIKLYDKTYNQDYFSKAKKVVDSGGYQISTGYISKVYIPDFIKAYFTLLHHPSVGKYCEYILSLDMVGDKPTFSNKKELDTFNRMFLDECIQEPKNIREKIYFVYHFINPRLEQSWWNLIEDYGTYFDNYSIGGLVAFSRGASFPFSVYALPLLKIINFKERKQMLDSFTFHILGVSSFTDIVSFIIIEKALKYIYDIDIKINFDSTRVLRETSMGKTVPIYYNGNFLRLSYKPKFLHVRNFQSYTNADLFKYTLEYLNNTFNFSINIPDKISPENCYHDNGKGQAVREYECSLVLASIASIQKVVEVFNETSNDVIKAWSQNQITKAESLIRYMIEQASFNRRTRTTVFKTRSILNTLEFIKKKPDLKTLNQLMVKTMEGVQEFKIFDKPDDVELSSISLF